MQVVCHAVSMVYWDNRRIPFCIAAGFLVAVAVFAGTAIREEPEKAKSYKEWAEEFVDGE